MIALVSESFMAARDFKPTPMAERLKVALEIRNVSEFKLAKAIGAASQTVNDFVLGRSQRTYLVGEMAEALNIDAEWLRTGRGTAPTADDGLVPVAEQRQRAPRGSADPARAQPQAPASDFLSRLSAGNGRPPARNDYRPQTQPLPRFQELPRDVPVYGVAAANDGSRSAVDYQLNGQVLDMVRRPPGLAFAPLSFAVVIVSTSMMPRFKPGETVFVNPARKPMIGDEVLVELHPTEDGEAPEGLVKTLVKQTGTKLVLGQYNPSRDDIEFPVKRLKNLYRIVPWDEALGF